MPPVRKENVRSPYWRSLDDLMNRSPFTGREIHGVPEGIHTPATRREFMKLMAASLALAGMTSCRWPEQQIAPYAGRPRGRAPGDPVEYATAFDLAGSAMGLLVTSYDGRPIKVDGNPSDPISRGSTAPWAQASILELYDPDRSKSIIRRERREQVREKWEDFKAFARQHFGSFRSSGGSGLGVLREASSSPSLSDMQTRFMNAFPEAKWYEYEPISRDNERLGSAIAFGKPYRTHLAIDRATVIVSLDADILMTHPASLRYARDFAGGRNPENGMSRLYVAESSYTVTGSMADHRFPLRSSEIGALAFALTLEVFLQLGLNPPEALHSAAEPPGSFPRTPLPRKLIQTIARDLTRHKGECIVTVGPAQSPATHALAHLLNEILGNLGNTLSQTLEPDPDRLSHVEAIEALCTSMRSGDVDTLLILGGNPVYNAPADVDFEESLSNVSTTIHVSLYRNETSRQCTWHIPRAHFLESWGDARGYDGTLYAVQPLIAPLYNGRSTIEILATVSDDPTDGGYNIVRRTAQGFASGVGFEDFWRSFLHRGTLPGSAFPAESPKVQTEDLMRELNRVELEDVPEESIEVTLHQDLRIYDGRFANNGWLQELPDPITKLTWDNAALLAPETAGHLGVQTGELITLRRSEQELTLPVYVTPGQARGSVAVSLGYGRTTAGRVGNGVGVDAYRFRTTRSMGFESGVSLQTTGERYRLASTQDHHSIRPFQGRSQERRVADLVREFEVEEYESGIDSLKHQGHHGKAPSLWKEHEYEGHRWGMAIDLNRCIGCSACVVACQAENNIPIIGKEQVMHGREMHWIRVDRYFKGDPADPQVVHQPLTCVHCETAPCEQVCPVTATVHSEEGLNQMVYNRCVGTRYCSNNCPLKVRRFNFFNYHKNLPDTEKMLFNPEVTVRSRGVMEKCTYCVQQIQAAKIKAGIERRPITDGEVVPACAQVCPTQAIVFGDLNDRKSKVARLQSDRRAYEIVPELNLRSRTLYLARITNPNPELRKETDVDHGEV